MMTICLAALCDDGKSCVVCADRMSVFGAGSLLEFKKDDSLRKIHPLSSDSVLLHSGSAQDAQAIVERMRATPADTNHDVPTRLEQVLTELLSEKRDRRVRHVLGGDYDYNKLVTSMATAPAGPIRDIWQQVRQLDLGDMLLVSQSKGRYAIHLFRPPETAVQSDLHYLALGSGWLYGRAAMTIQQYAISVSIPEAALQVYSAKKASEIVYGVGEPTDMAVVTRRRVIEVSREAMAQLEKIRAKRAKSHLTQTEIAALRQELKLH